MIGVPGLQDHGHHTCVDLRVDILTLVMDADHVGAGAADNIQQVGQTAGKVQKTVAEGAGATPVAACMSGKVDTTKKTVCVVSGGNVDVTMLERILTPFLLKVFAKEKQRPQPPFFHCSSTTYPLRRSEPNIS